MSSDNLHILLLDGRIIALPYKPNALTSDLILAVTAFLGIGESDFFGLTYRNYRGTEHWLQNNKKLSEHDIRQSGELIQFVFRIRFYSDRILSILEPIVYEQFFLQAKRLLHKGSLDCSLDDHIRLVALELYTKYGKHVDQERSRSNLMKCRAFPSKLLRKMPSMDHCVDATLAQYRSLTNMTRGDAMLEFLEVVETIPSFGIHFFDVMEKNNMPWLLGLRFNGIVQCDLQNKNTCKRLFLWKHIQSMFYRDKKFSIEINENRRNDSRNDMSTSDLSPSYRDMNNSSIDGAYRTPDNDTAHSAYSRGYEGDEIQVAVWYTSSPELTKTLWTEASAYYTYFNDHNAFDKSSQNSRDKSLVKRELTDWLDLGGSLKVTSGRRRLAEDSQLVIFDSIHVVFVSNEDESLDSQFGESEDSCLSSADRSRRVEELHMQKEALSQLLSQKEDLFKQLCLEEAEITGSLPEDYVPGPGESPIKVRRRIQTSFKLSPQIIGNKSSSSLNSLNNGSEVDGMQQLEIRYDLQKQIVNANMKLAGEINAPKSVRKKHKEVLDQSVEKLKYIEVQIGQHRRAVFRSSQIGSGQPPFKPAMFQKNSSLGKPQSTPSAMSSPSLNNNNNNTGKSRSLSYGDGHSLNGLQTPSLRTTLSQSPLPAKRVPFRPPGTNQQQPMRAVRHGSDSVFDDSSSTSPTPDWIPGSQLGYYKQQRQSSNQISPRGGLTADSSPSASLLSERVTSRRPPSGPKVDDNQHGMPRSGSSRRLLIPPPRSTIRPGTSSHNAPPSSSSSGALPHRPLDNDKRSASETNLAGRQFWYEPPAELVPVHTPSGQDRHRTTVKDFRIVPPPNPVTGRNPRIAQLGHSQRHGFGSSPAIHQINATAQMSESRAFEKPYEISDYYKYSESMNRQRQLQSVTSLTQVQPEPNSSRVNYSSENPQNMSYRQQDAQNPTHRAQDAQNPSYRQQDAQNPSYRPQDSPNTSYRQQDVPNSSYRQHDAQNPSYRPQDSPNTSYRQQDVPNSSYRQQDVQNPSYRQHDAQNPSYRPQDSPNPSYRQQYVQNPSYRPQDAQNSTHRPQDAQNPTYRQQDAQNSTYRPQDAQNSTYRPQDAPNMSYRPQDAQNPTYRPQDAQNTSYRPQDAQSPSYRPQDAPNSSYRPASNQSNRRDEALNRPQFSCNRAQDSPNLSNRYQQNAGFSPEIRSRGPVTQSSPYSDYSPMYNPSSALEESIGADFSSEMMSYMKTYSPSNN